MLGVHFFEPLCPCEDKISIKKVFHFWPLEIAARVHANMAHQGCIGQHMLGAISEGQKWKTFSMLILSLHGY